MPVSNRSHSVVVSVATLALACASCASTDHASKHAYARSDQAVQQPASARAALEGVIGVLESERAKGHWIAIESVGAAPGRETIDVKLDLLILADDDIQASRHYAELVGALESSSWCEGIAPSSTRSLTDSTGIRVVNMVIACRPTSVPLASLETPSMEPFIRSVAANDDVRSGPVIIKPSIRQTRNAVDHRYAIRPTSGKQTLSFASVMNFVTLLEAEGQGVVVTKIDLDRAGSIDRDQIDDEWKFKIETTIRAASM